MNIEAALREWEAQCWEQYNHENDYDEYLERNSEEDNNDSNSIQRN